MPSLILKFKDRELQECAVGLHPVSIGRLPDNEIVIDNEAVSGRHARVFSEGDHYVVEDLKSTNGTFVNGKAISRHTLLDGDVLIVCKHSVVFTLAGGDRPPQPAASGPFVPDIGGTSILDPERQKALLESLDRGRPSPQDAVIPKTAVPAPPPRTGSVRVVSGKSDRDEYPLTAVTTLIGKAENTQIRTTGWFKPKVSAAIGRKGDGFTVTPIGANVAVNNQKVSGRHELRDGDLIQVSGLTLEFRSV